MVSELLGGVILLFIVLLAKSLAFSDSIARPKLPPPGANASKGFRAHVLNLVRATHTNHK